MTNTKYIEVDPANTPLPQLHQFLLGSVSPRPICFASTIDLEGRPNLAPFSFFNVVSVSPPVIVFSPNNSGRDGTPKQTFLNAPWEHGVSEFEKAGFTPVASDLVKPFRVAESPVQIECKVIDIKEFGEGGGSGKMIMAQVVKMHVKEEVLGADGKIDPFKMNLEGRMGGAWYCLPDRDSMFELSQPMQHTIGYDALPAAIRESEILTANQLGQLSGLLGWPTEDEKLAAIEFLGIHQLVDGKDVRDMNDSAKQTAAVALMLHNRVREAAALLLL